MRIMLLVGAFLFLCLFTYTKNVFAQSGCCSWHGGVRGCDTSIGVKVCNDGTYSPSCTCAFYPQGRYIPKPPDFPIMNATWEWTPNSYGTFTITITLDDPDPTQYSVILSKYAGGDP